MREKVYEKKLWFRKKKKTLSALRQKKEEKDYVKNRNECRAQRKI